MAALSMAGFNPSRKALNIFGFRPPSFACSAVTPQWSYTASGVDSLYFGSHL
jgi:hypothetical protein